MPSSPDTIQSAQAKAAELGLTLSEYSRQVLAKHNGRPYVTGDPQRVLYELRDAGGDGILNADISDIARLSKRSGPEVLDQLQKQGLIQSALERRPNRAGQVSTQRVWRITEEGLKESSVDAARQAVIEAALGFTKVALRISTGSDGGEQVPVGLAGVEQ